MDSTSDLIKLANMDGHSMYDRFEVIRSIIRQAMISNDDVMIQSYYAEIMLNMMLMKISLYVDPNADPLHFFSDYQQFLAFIKDAVDYIKERYKEVSNTSGFNELATVDMIANHFEEYMKHHVQTTD